MCGNLNTGKGRKNDRNDFFHWICSRFTRRGLGVVLGRNPVHCALSLVGTLVGMAVLFVLQNAVLVAAVQIIVYAGAIVVLFLFVIMLIGVDRAEQVSSTRSVQRIVALVSAVVIVVGLVALGGRHWVTGQSHVRGSLHDSQFHSNVDRVAHVIFTEFAWPFELTAALLAIAVVGAVVLASREVRSRT